MIDPKQHRPRPTLVLGAALVAAVFAFAACSDGGGEAPAPSKPAASKPAATSPPPEPETPAPAAEEHAATADPTDLAERGRTVYMANCIACHNQDPAQDGALGPAIKGSSRELIEARVMRGEYPEGYTPKRTSKVMIPLPHLNGELDALAAFLGSRS